MSVIIDVVTVVGIVGYVIARQRAGEPLRARRVILLPAILIVIGVIDLHSSALPTREADIACLVIGGVLVAGIGAAQALVLRLESRDGYLWAQMPPKGLWLWAALILTRVGMTLAADGTFAPEKNGRTFLPALTGAGTIAAGQPPAVPGETPSPSSLDRRHDRRGQ